MLYKKVLEIHEEYNKQYDHLVEMLQSCEKQGTAIQQSTQVESFMACLGKPYEPSAHHKKEMGVYTTS
jgi:hypothetical protein